LVYLVAIWYICSRLDMLCQEKSGNPGCTKELAFCIRVYYVYTYVRTVHTL
jgi:hypothetical protein